MDIRNAKKNDVNSSAGNLPSATKYVYYTIPSVVACCLATLSYDCGGF